jgi:hypothetical protein
LSISYLLPEDAAAEFVGCLDEKPDAPSKATMSRARFRNVTGKLLTLEFDIMYRNDNDLKYIGTSLPPSDKKCLPLGEGLGISEFPWATTGCFQFARFKVYHLLMEFWARRKTLISELLVCQSLGEGVLLFNSYDDSPF